MLSFCAIIQSEKRQGSLWGQAERKHLVSTLLPDADNAVVGSHTLEFLQEKTVPGISCFLFTIKHCNEANQKEI